MCKIQNMLGQACSLNHAADFDGAFFLDEFADGVEQ
jgi:hypothetical protein